MRVSPVFFARAAAHHGDGFARGHVDRRVGHRIRPHRVHRELFPAADVDGRVDDAAAALALSWMLADHSACRGEGIAVPDRLNGPGAVPLPDESDIGGHVHMRGTQRHAGHSPGGKEFTRERNLFSAMSMRSFILPRFSRYLTE